MDEEDDFGTAATNPLAAAVGQGGYSPARAAEQLDKLFERYTGADRNRSDVLNRVSQSRAQRFAEAEEEIRKARFGMPLGSEQMYAISSALLSPRRMRGLAGTLDNLVPALGSISAARRQADEARAEALAKMREQYGDAGDKQAIEAAEADRKGLLDLVKTYAGLAKGQQPQTTYDMLTGRVIDKNAGTATPVREVAPPPSPQQMQAGLTRLRGYLTSPNATPEGKGQAIMNFAVAANMDPREVSRLLGME
jgi:hypothetical protein